MRLMFTTVRGKVIRRSDFDTAIWAPAAKAAGLAGGSPNGFHALRHHFASVLLDAGVSIKEVATLLGHRDASFTLRTYTHLLPGGDGKMKAAVDALLNGESEGPRKAQGHS